MAAPATAAPAISPTFECDVDAASEPAVPVGFGAAEVWAAPTGVASLNVDTIVSVPLTDVTYWIAATELPVVEDAEVDDSAELFVKLDCELTVGEVVCELLGADVAVWELVLVVVARTLTVTVGWVLTVVTGRTSLTVVVSWTFAGWVGEGAVVVEVEVVVATGPLSMRK